jgi:hypothetical protein
MASDPKNIGELQNALNDASSKSARPVCLAASRRQRNGDGINIVIDLRKL